MARRWPDRGAPLKTGRRSFDGDGATGQRLALTNAVALTAGALRLPALALTDALALPRSFDEDGATSGSKNGGPNLPNLINESVLSTYGYRQHCSVRMTPLIDTVKRYRDNDTIIMTPL